MDGSSSGVGFLSGSSDRFLDGGGVAMERHQQGQMGISPITQQPHQLQLQPMNMMGGLENEQPLGFFETKGLSSFKGMSMDFSKGKGVSLGHSYSNNTTSEDEEPSFAGDVNGENCDGINCKKESPWHRMKWTDNIIRLLIAVVASVGDDVAHENTEGLKRKSGVLHKKGKWKMVSKIMISRGSCVSPQQCEDKFNDLNKRYKKLNDILGRGTSCQVVENPSLMDSMPQLTAKAKEEVKKILNSKHLFYREMCAYHNGQKIPGCHDIDLLAHSSPLVAHPNCNDGSEEHDAEEEDESEDDDSSDNDEKNVQAHTGIIERNSFNIDNSNLWPLSSGQDGNRMTLAAIPQDQAKPPVTKRELVQQQIWKLEEQRVRLQAETLEVEKQRFKWLRFRSKKDRELERLRMENERMKLENERMVLLFKQQALQLGVQKPETSPEQTSDSTKRLQGAGDFNLDIH